MQNISDMLAVLFENTYEVLSSSYREYIYTDNSVLASWNVMSEEGKRNAVQSVIDAENIFETTNSNMTGGVGLYDEGVSNVMTLEEHVGMIDEIINGKGEE